MRFSTTTFLVLSLLLACSCFAFVTASKSQPHLNNYVSHRLHSKVPLAKRAVAQAKAFEQDLKLAHMQVNAANMLSAQQTLSSERAQRGKRLFAQELSTPFDAAKARAASPLSQARHVKTGISDVGIIVLCVVLGFFFLLFLGFGTRYYVGRYAYGASPTTVVQTQPSVVAQPAVVAQPTVVSAAPSVVTTRPSAVVI